MVMEIALAAARTLFRATWITINKPNNIVSCVAIMWTLSVLAQGIGLKYVQIDVPGAVHVGEPSWLVCDYDLGEDELYSVKWYKNDLEFYRYLPSDSPPAQKYDQLGVYVNLSMSNSTHVYLYKTDLNTEGNYGCEVSTEGPSFRTVKADKELRIYVIPSEGPLIEGLELPYYVGDIVNITCISGPSKPFSHMKWYLNGEEISPTFEFRYSPVPAGNGLQTTVIGLNFVIDYSHIWRSKLTVACTSSIPQVYSSASEELVIDDAGSSANPYQVFHKAADQKGPLIEGNLPWYDVGDIISVNCSSSRTTIPAHIRWFVNGIEPKKDYLLKYPTKYFPDGTEVSKLGLRMRVESAHFKSDEMRIKCTSTLYRMLTRRAENMLISSADSRRLSILFSRHMETVPGIWKYTVVILIILAKDAALKRFVMN